MSSVDLQQDYFQLFAIPASFELDTAALGERFRELQQHYHPDRLATASAREQRVAVQQSTVVNEAYETLRHPLRRALYLMARAGVDEAEVMRSEMDGSFLLAQMALRESLEHLPSSADPEQALDELLVDVRRQTRQLQSEFARAYDTGDLALAAKICVKMQYLDKLLIEVEQVEDSLLD